MQGFAGQQCHRGSAGTIDSWPDGSACDAAGGRALPGGPTRLLHREARAPPPFTRRRRRLWACHCPHPCPQAGPPPLPPWAARRWRPAWCRWRRRRRSQTPRRGAAAGGRSGRRGVLSGQLQGKECKRPGAADGVCSSGGWGVQQRWMGCAAAAVPPLHEFPPMPLVWCGASSEQSPTNPTNRNKKSTLLGSATRESRPPHMSM